MVAYVLRLFFNFEKVDTLIGCGIEIESPEKSTKETSGMVLSKAF